MRLPHAPALTYALAFARMLAYAGVLSRMRSRMRLLFARIRQRRRAGSVHRGVVMLLFK